MVYNLTGIIAANSTGMLGLVQGVNNTLSLGWLGTFFLLGVTAIFYMSFIFKTDGDVPKSLAATSFICFILTLLLVAVDLITNPLVIFLALIASAATVAFTWRK